MLARMVAPRASTCAACGGAQIVFDRAYDRARARACACADACSTCGGSGQLFQERDGYSFVRTCDCRSAGARAARYTQIGIPALFAGQTFDIFHPYNAEQEHALRVCREIGAAYRVKSPPRGVVLSGPVGTGKTHLLCATLGYLATEQGAACRYVEISFLYSEIRYGFQAGRSGLDAIRPLVDADVLAIDELGKGKGSAFELETLDELIARRYNVGRTTLLATNQSTAEAPRRDRPRDGYADLGPDAIEARAEQLLRERVGERIYSRLHQMCQFVEFPVETQDVRRLGRA